MKNCSTHDVILNVYAISFLKNNFPKNFRRYCPPCIWCLKFYQKVLAKTFRTRWNFFGQTWTKFDKHSRWISRPKITVTSWSQPKTEDLLTKLTLNFSTLNDHLNIQFIWSLSCFGNTDYWNWNRRNFSVEWNCWSSKFVPHWNFNCRMSEIKETVIN
jgi:hypothetical protein